MLVKNGPISLVMLAVFFGFACGRVEKMLDDIAAPTPPPENVTPVRHLPELVLKPDAELQRQIEAITKGAKGKVGVSAVVLETGDFVSVNGDDHFAMQSVYKLPIAMAALQQVDADKLALEEMIAVTKDDHVSPGQRSPIRDNDPNGTTMSIRDLVHFAVSESDGTASDVLLRTVGGPEAVQNYLAATGVADMKVANAEKEFPLDWQVQYRNWTTPNAAIALLRNLHESNGISAGNRELLLRSMTESPTGPKRLKGLLPAGTAVAHKTGTSGTRSGVNAATNDIGIITLPNGRHILIAVFVGDSTADEKVRENVIARIAKAAWDRFTAPA
jgi:beta-lactamase class A